MAAEERHNRFIRWGLSKRQIEELLADRFPQARAELSHSVPDGDLTQILVPADRPHPSLRLGGDNSVDNLRLLCGAHNRQRQRPGPVTDSSADHHNSSTNCA